MYTNLHNQFIYFFGGSRKDERSLSQSIPTLRDRNYVTIAQTHVFLGILSVCSCRDRPWGQAKIPV